MVMLQKTWNNICADRHIELPSRTKTFFLPPDEVPRSLLVCRNLSRRPDSSALQFLAELPKLETEARPCLRRAKSNARRTVVWPRALAPPGACRHTAP